ncbi:MAG: hypothetical protein FWE98_01435 [Oscillospiraceae bacterium]|nr:hypothetical protein [Oscillospiraceae bacterium]
MVTCRNPFTGEMEDHRHQPDWYYRDEVTKTTYPFWGNDLPEYVRNGDGDSFTTIRYKPQQPASLASHVNPTLPAPSNPQTPTTSQPKKFKFNLEFFKMKFGAEGEGENETKDARWMAKGILLFLLVFLILLGVFFLKKNWPFVGPKPFFQAAQEIHTSGGPYHKFPPGYGDGFDYFQMNSVEYRNGMTWSLQEDASEKSTIASYILKEEYKTITGIIGHIDSLAKASAELLITGDGSEIKRIELDGDMEPYELKLNVVGVEKIEFRYVLKGRVWEKGTSESGKNSFVGYGFGNVTIN